MFWPGFKGFPKPASQLYAPGNINQLILSNRSSGRAFFAQDFAVYADLAFRFIVPPGIYLLFLSAVAGGGAGGGNNGPGLGGGNTIISLQGATILTLIGGEGGLGSAAALAAATATSSWQNRWPGTAGNGGFGGYGGDSMFGLGAPNQGTLTSGGNPALGYGAGGGGSRTSPTIASAGGNSGEGVAKIPLKVEPGWIITGTTGAPGQGQGATIGGAGGPGFALFEW